MIFRRPYAFFIKYFRLINLGLSFLVFLFIIKLNNLHNILNQIYLSDISNFNYLNEEYIGFWMFLLIIIIMGVLLLIILLLKRKKKPYKDYLFLLMYNVIIIIYLLVVSDLFFVLLDSIVEQNKLKLYSDISLIIFLPLLYFFIKYFMIAIGFNLTKFNFAKDLVELKAEDSDNEEVELILNKNTYKYKRSIRKRLREFKYYVLENKLFVVIFVSIVFVIGIYLLSRINVSEDEKIRLKESFVSNSISYIINNVYETRYDKNNRIIKNDYKYVIADVKVRNVSNEVMPINLKNIRIFYGEEFSYANNYFNNSFLDLGVPYNNDYLVSGKEYNYLLIFQVPNNYKSKNYKIKFYSGLSYSEDSVNGVYKTLSINAENIDNDDEQKSFILGDNVIFDKNKYGQSNITLKNYEIKNNFIIENNGKYEVIKSKDLNLKVLSLDVDLFIDENSLLNKLNSGINSFFNNYLRIEYTYNGKTKKLNNINQIKSNMSEKIYISVPSEITEANEISLIIKFRNLEIIYKLK